jgi:hypothetical protein
MELVQIRRTLVGRFTTEIPKDFDQALALTPKLRLGNHLSSCANFVSNWDCETKR